MQSVADLSYQDREMETYELDVNVPPRSNNSSRRGSMKASLFPELPRSHKPSPAPRRQMHKSAGDLSSESRYQHPKPVVNPRSHQKGLLRIISSAESSPSKIPRRISVTKSMERIPPVRRKSISRAVDRRGRSTSPERQRSVDSSTMIDLGVTASSMVRSANRISKTSALSPIAGTPNRDGENNTKIPVRRNSSINLNVKNGSRGNSRTNSRDPSPTKPGTNKSPTKIPSKVGQAGLKKVSSIVKMSGAKRPTITTTGKEQTESAKTRIGPVGPNAKKETASARKEPSTVTREKSSVKKAPPATIKREPSTLKRQPSNLKRETSNLKPTTLKRESSNLLKRQTSTIKPREPSALLKNQSDSSLTKRLEKKSSFKNKRRTSSESDGLNEKGKTTANENDSSDKLITLPKTNVVSMTTAAIASQPIQITAAVTNQLNKSNSSGQIVHTNSDTVASTGDERRELTTPAEIIEKSQKTLETIQKTVTDATDEIQKTIEENLTDLKTLEKDMAMNSGAMAAESADTIAPLQKKASTRTLGTKSDIVSGDAAMTEGNAATNDGESAEVVNSPIETTVNVIDSTGEVTTLQTQDSDERISERAISMGPDVELEGSNVQKMEESTQNSNGGPSHMDPVSGAKDHT